MLYPIRIRRERGRIAPIALAVIAATCSSPTKPGPVVVELAIQSVSPEGGPATGGTDVTIRGTGFAAGTAVTIGGRAATDVSVRGNDVITAKTPASVVAGSVDIAVTLNGRTGTLAGAFRYEVTANTAPTIRSITAQGTRPRQPALFADYGETIRVSAVVEDAETPVAQLKYEWQACGGTFTGSGSQVDWTIPASGTVPPMCTVELLVIDGSRVASASVVVRLHDSIREVSLLALEFLEEFADSTIEAERTVRNFWNSCQGKADELKDVTNNRATRTITSHIYGTPAVTVAFGAVCRTPNTVDACARTSVEWQSTVKATGAAETVKGISIISGVYRDSRWWLCDSNFEGVSSLGLHFMR